jgi:hypothetical protein
MIGSYQVSLGCCMVESKLQAYISKCVKIVEEFHLNLRLLVQIKL